MAQRTKVLLLGAGLVARPLVDYLSSKDYIFLTIASRTKKGIEDTENRKFEVLNIQQDEEKLESLVKDHDIVISLLPYIYHVKVAKLCLKHQSHLVTTSYVSPEMASLDEEAKSKGLLFLNEMGLDPGIDHMSAMKLMDEYRGKGWKIEAFTSFCGGLPARDSNDNPLGYKFSWSPRGVLLAGNNSAQFINDGNIEYIPSSKLFKSYIYLDVEGVGTFEAYPNRDSVPYKNVYGLSDAHTVYRGTLRNPGWCYFMQKVKELGILDPTPRKDLAGKTYGQMLAELIDSDSEWDLAEETAWYLGVDRYSDIIKKLEWLGLFNIFKKIPPAGQESTLDAFCELLKEKLSLKEGDRDWIVLVHRFVVSKANETKVLESVLSLEGEKDGYSAMAKTVSIPAAIAAALMAQKKIDAVGVKIPVEKAIYQPVLEELEAYGISFLERELTPESKVNLKSREVEK